MDNKLEARYMYIVVHVDHYLHMMKNDMILDKVVNPLPQDTRWVRGGNDAMGNMVMIVESSEFEIVNEGDEIPFYGRMVFERAFPNTVPKN